MAIWHYMSAGGDSGKSRGPEVWAPISREEWEKIQAEWQRHPRTPEIDWKARIRFGVIVPLHPTTELERRQCVGFDVTARVSRVGAARFSPNLQGLRLAFDRDVRGEDGFGYLILRVEGAEGTRPETAAGIPLTHIVMAPSLRVVPTPRPTYVVELSVPITPLDSTKREIEFESLDAFQRFTVRLQPRAGPTLGPSEAPAKVIGRRIQIAISLPSPVTSIADAEVIATLPIPRFQESFLLKLQTPLTGPELGLQPWTTSHLVLVPRTHDRLEHLFDPEFVGLVHVNLFRPISETRLVSGEVVPENLVPLAAGQVLPAGAAPQGAIDGLIFFGIPGGLTKPTPEDEVIQELYPGHSAIPMRLPAGTEALQVPKGTKAEEIEKRTGKKWTLYGSDPKGQGNWIYIKEEDDRKIVLQYARENWDNLKAVARAAGVAMDARYYVEAEQIAGRVLELKPGNFLALSVLAGAKCGVGKFTEGKEILQKVIAARPNSEYPHYLMAQVLLREKKIEEALESLKRAVYAAPEDRQAMNLMFVIYQDDLKDEREGLWQLLDVAATYPSSHGPLGFLSAVFQAKGNSDLAVEFARAAYERRQIEDTVSNLTAQLGMAGRTGEIIRFLDRIHSSSALGYKSLGNLATAYEESGDIRRALETLAQMRTVAPPDVVFQIDGWIDRLRRHPSS